MHRRGFSCHLVERSTMRIRYLHAVLVPVGLPQSLPGLEKGMGNNRGYEFKYHQKHTSLKCRKNGAKGYCMSST